jgi:hypothetical protein
MSWDYRILVTEYTYKNGEVEEYFQIHEVYYDNNKVPKSHTIDGITVGGESIYILKDQLIKFKECFKKPVLWGDERFPEKHIAL